MHIHLAGVVGLVDVLELYDGVHVGVGGKWMSCSPSPRPSPLGRGSIVARLLANSDSVGWSARWEWISLSPRGRAGVRGKEGSELRRRLGSAVVTSRRELMLVLAGSGAQTTTLPGLRNRTPLRRWQPPTARRASAT